MKKINYLLFLVLLAFPMVVMAAGGVSVNKKSISVAPNGTTSFDIVTNNAAGKVTVSSSDSSIVSVNGGDKWVENNSVPITVTGKKTGNAKIIIVIDVATFDKVVIKDKIEIPVRVTSTNNSLASLALNNGSLSPSFNANTTNYSATIDSASTTINAKVADSTAKVSGTGNKSLKYGKNTFNVVVTSESGATKQYTIVINRPDNRSSNNNLKSLSTSVGNLSFNKNTVSYSVNVAANVASAKIDASVEDGKASFVSGFGPRTVNLKYGKNPVQIKVKAENEKIKVYTININREDNRSKNANLISLSLSAGSISFHKDTVIYNVSVPYEVTKININAIAEDGKSKVVVNNTDLVVGDNVATIVVTSEAGVVKTYTLNIKRLTEAEKMSDNNNVSSIDIFGHDFDLLDDVFEYDINIASNEKDLLFNVLMEDDGANYIIEGNEKLKDGSVITIKAISESGIEKEYKFNINKEAISVNSSNESDVWIYVMACLVCLIIGYGMGFLTPMIVNKLKPAAVDVKPVTKKVVKVVKKSSE